MDAARSVNTSPNSHRKCGMRTSPSQTVGCLRVRHVPELYAMGNPDIAHEQRISGRAVLFFDEAQDSTGCITGMVMRQRGKMQIGCAGTPASPFIVSVGVWILCGLSRTPKTSTGTRSARRSVSDRGRGACQRGAQPSRTPMFVSFRT